jgi:hypothetical protein
MVLAELERRKGPEALKGLATAAGSSDATSRQYARDLLDRHLTRQGEAVVRQRLKDDFAEVRQAAARVAARMPKLGGDLIDLLDDEVPAVRAVARQSLLTIGKGVDFGPDTDAGKEARALAQKKWREWWDGQGH